MGEELATLRLAGGRSAAPVAYHELSARLDACCTCYPDNESLKALQVLIYANTTRTPFLKLISNINIMFSSAHVGFRANPRRTNVFVRGLTLNPSIVPRRRLTLLT